MSNLEAANFDDEFLSAYLDDELAPEERARVEERLAADPAARQLLDELRAVSRTMQDLPRASLGADLRETVLRRAERAMLVSGKRASDFGELDSAELVEVSRVARGLSDFARKLPIGRSKRSWFWAGAALAAGLLIMVYSAGPDRNQELPGEVAKRESAVSGERRPALELRTSSKPQEAAAEIAESPSLAPASAAPTAGALVESDAVAVAGSGGAVAGRDTLAFDVTDDADLLVIHVNVKPETLQRRAIDEVFAKHQIVIEETTGGVPTADEPQNVDLVWVEAAPAQIMSSLAEINADHANYLGIVVDDELAVSQQARAAKQPAADMKKYNRGVVPRQQKMQVAPNNNYYYQTERGRIEIDRRLADLGDVEQQTLGKDVSQLANRGRAMRVAPPAPSERFSISQQSPDALHASTETASPSPSQQAASPGDDRSYGNAKLGLARRGMQKLAAKADMMQVLFVITAGEERAPSPPADNRVP